MKTMTITAALLIASQAYAQEDPVERQIQRLKDRLQLNDEQTGKIREIMKKNNEDLKGVLTDEQKKQYDEMNSGGGRGGPGGRGGGGFGGWGGFGGLPSTDELKTQLKLADDQVTKINEVRDEIRQQMREYWQNRQGGGNFDEARKEMEKMVAESTKKVRELLTDEQKPKFDEIVKNAQQGGDNPRFGPPGGGRGRPSVDDRVRGVMERLKIESAEEAAAVRDLVKKVVEAQHAMEDYERDSRRKIDELARKTDAGEEEIKTSIEDLRTGRKEKDKGVKDAQKPLAEIVTYKQELELIRQGILR